MVNIEDILEQLATRPMSSQRQRRTAGGGMYTDTPFIVVQNLPPNIIEYQNILNEWRIETFTLRALLARKRK
jgi:hypothetical protein